MGVKMTLHDTERTFTIRRIKYSGKAAWLCNCTETLAVSQSVKCLKWISSQRMSWLSNSLSKNIVPF